MRKQIEPLPKVYDLRWAIYYLISVASTLPMVAPDYKLDVIGIIAALLGLFWFIAYFASNSYRNKEQQSVYLDAGILVVGAGLLSLVISGMTALGLNEFGSQLDIDEWHEELHSAIAILVFITGLFMCIAFEMDVISDGSGLSPLKILGAVTVPIIAVSILRFALYVSHFDVFLSIVVVAAGLFLFAGLIIAVLWVLEKVEDWKIIPSPPMEYVPSPVSMASYQLKLDFSSNLKKLRETACRTEESVARKAGLPVGELRKIESCMNNFNMSAAFACLKTLDHHIEVENECGSVVLYSASDALSWLAGMVCGLPVQQVASDAGVSPTMLGFAIEGKTPLSIDVFAGICSLFRASVKFVRNRQELQVAKK